MHVKKLVVSPKVQDDYHEYSMQSCMHIFAFEVWRSVGNNMLYHIVLLFLLSYCVFETDEQNVDAGGLDKPEIQDYYLYDIPSIFDLTRMKASSEKYTCVYVYHPTWPCFRNKKKPPKYY